MTKPSPHPILRFFLPERAETLSLGERTKLNIILWAAGWQVALGVLFSVLNIAGGLFGIASINLCTVASGLITLFLLSRRLYTQAGVVLIVVSGVCYSISGYFFRNGMELTLLLGMMGSSLMFESRLGRALLAGLNGIAFLVIKVLLFREAGSMEFPLPRYAINVTVFLIIYYAILTVFRLVNTSYRKELERKNSELAQSREKLDQEHASLVAKSEELEVANLAKEKLFSIVAHDLRGPMGNLKMTLDLLKSGDLTRHDFDGALTDLKVEVDHAYDCIDTLLNWSASQLEAIQPLFTEVRLAPIVERSAALFSESASRKGIALSVAVPTTAVVWVDENQLSAILRNLISNALKFTPVGGRVIVSAVEEKGEWLLSVTDSGIGMAPERVQYLFESGTAHSTLGTENEKGLGLGLQICLEFIRTSGGELKVESTEGKGSCFQFNLKAVNVSETLNQILD